MKSYPLPAILLFSVVLIFTGIIAGVAPDAAPQDYSRFRNQEADHQLTDASRRQSDECEFFSGNYETVGRILTRSNETRLTQSVRPVFLLKPGSFPAECVSTRFSFAPPMNSRLHLWIWLSPCFKARADPFTVQNHSVA
ncbi:hypothetical protein [uncultured Victivallis sp.]|uniref:hypothetical protein n=1 Tax=uncultured Victivallis sp. TaxID=354118 RepID=UPI0025E2C128|nr:hypothetical protein [uncultured Victivallis sp.]